MGLLRSTGHKILKKFVRRSPNYPVTLSPFNKRIRGRVLLSYIADPIVWPDGHPGLLSHSNHWECREISRLLVDMGYIVDAINWNDNAFNPENEYDVVLDIDSNLQRWAPLLPEKTIRILHLTGSYGPFQHKAELARVAEFEQRTGKLYSPKRLVRWIELAERSLRLAHYCSLIGNEFTLNTYPEAYRGKISLVPVSSSALPKVRILQEMVPEKREFLWFFGSGAVHKGLDLVLEVFCRHPDWTLHVVGDAVRERDFVAAYRQHLSQPNIRVHGVLIPGELSFLEKIKDVFCFIAPTCSEAISSAVVTCLQLGLFPILSRQTGVDLPAGCGIYLSDLKPVIIEQAIQSSLELDRNEIVRQSQACQATALEKYSREAFRQSYKNFLLYVLGN